MLKFRSSLFLVGYILSTIVFSFPSVLTFPFPFAWRYRFITQWSRFNLWWLKITCGLHYQVHGHENIPSTNAIVLSKHQSTWETLALQLIFPAQCWLIKRELLWLPFFGWGIAMLEPIAIDRKARRKALAQLLEQGADRLKKGRWIVIFPEGTRMPAGQRGTYRLGGARLAAATGYPIVPVAHNAGEHWPKQSYIKTPGVIQLWIGPPIPTQGRTAEEINFLAEDWIENKMLEITSKQRLLLEGK